MITPEQSNPPGNSQIGTEGDRRAAFGVAQAQHDHPEDRPDQRRQQDGQRQDLPATPGTEHGQQLEVAVAHALLAGHQLEQPEHRPQAQVAEHRAEQRIVEAGEEAEMVGDQAQPEQRQHQHVRQQLVIGIDQAHRQQTPGQQEHRARLPGEAEMPGDVAGKQRGGQFHQG